MEKRYGFLARSYGKQVVPQPQHWKCPSLSRVSAAESWASLKVLPDIKALISLGAPAQFSERVNRAAPAPVCCVKLAKSSRNIVITSPVGWDCDTQLKARRQGQLLFSTGG